LAVHDEFEDLEVGGLAALHVVVLSDLDLGGVAAAAFGQFFGVAAVHYGIVARIYYQQFVVYFLYAGKDVHLEGVDRVAGAKVVFQGFD
jgi:hypothetical protein